VVDLEGMSNRSILPRHRRVNDPPRMRLTQRDVQMVLAAYEYRVLRRDQIERLFFPSKNTANDRLKRLYQHRFLARRWVPVEYGQGTGQALYLLDERGANLVAEQLGIDRAKVRWRAAHNRVGSPFLEHTLMVNDVRIAFKLATEQQGYEIDKWVTEDELKAVKDYVRIEMQGGARRTMAVIPDGYFILNLGDRRAHFFLEVDRATLANRRWGWRVQAYLVYARSGKYCERFGTRSLRVLTVTTGSKRLSNLKRTTERAGGGNMFWFAVLAETQPDKVLPEPIWQVASQQGFRALVERDGSDRDPAAQSERVSAERATRSAAQNGHLTLSAVSRQTVLRTWPLSSGAIKRCQKTPPTGSLCRRHQDASLFPLPGPLIL